MAAAGRHLGFIFLRHMSVTNKDICAKFGMSIDIGHITFITAQNSISVKFKFKLKLSAH